jgi:hypothetical protein
MTLCRSITLFQFGSYRTQIVSLCYPKIQDFRRSDQTRLQIFKVCAGNMYFGGSAFN